MPLVSNRYTNTLSTENTSAQAETPLAVHPKVSEGSSAASHGHQVLGLLYPHQLSDKKLCVCLGPAVCQGAPPANLLGGTGTWPASCTSQVGPGQTCTATCGGSTPYGGATITCGSNLQWEVASFEGRCSAVPGKACAWGFVTRGLEVCLTGTAFWGWRLHRSPGCHSLYAWGFKPSSTPSMCVTAPSLRCFCVDRCGADCCVSLSAPAPVPVARFFALQLAKVCLPTRSQT